MVDSKQLESQLSSAIQLAQELPETAEPISIWDKYYQVISKLPGWQQLLISGEALNQLAEVTLLKSSCYFGDESEDAELVEDLPEDQGVALDEEWLEGLIRKTSSLDLSRFEKPDTRFRLPGEGSWDDAETATSDLVEEAIIDSPEALDEVLAIAHVESASDWQSKILSTLEVEPLPIDFWILKAKTELSPSALFLGLLLGSEQWYLKKNDDVISEGGYGSILISLTEFEPVGECP